MQPFRAQISPGSPPGSLDHSPGELIFDAAQNRVWTEWRWGDRPNALEVFSIRLQGVESDRDLSSFLEEHADSIVALFDRTTRGQWSEVHALREGLASAWSLAAERVQTARSEAAREIDRWDCRDRLPSLEQLESIWSDPNARRVLRDVWEDHRTEAQDFQILHEGFGGPADEDDPETARRLEVLRAQRERIESVMRLMFPRQDLSIEELRGRYPAMVDAEKRGLAAEWALRVEYKGENPPGSMAESSDRSLLRRSVLNRLGVLEQVAEELRADYALAVRADAVEAEQAPRAERGRAPRNPHTHRDEVLRLIRDEQLPERFQRLEGFIRAAFPERVGELKEPHESLQALVQVFERGTAEQWVKEERDRLIFRREPALFSGAATWPEWDERAYSVMIESLERMPQAARGLRTQALEVARENLERVRGEIYAPLEAAAARLVEKGETSAERLRAAQQAVRQGLEQEGARWIGQISTGWRPGQLDELPRMAELAMRVVTRTEAAMDELEDRSGQQTAAGESPEQRVEEKRLQHALAVALLEAQVEGHHPSTRAVLDRALLERRAENWVEREWMRAVQRKDVPGFFPDPIHKLEGCDRQTCRRLAGPDTDAWAYARAREAIERAAGADPELRARALEIAQADAELAEQSIEQALDGLEHEEELGHEWELEI
jgi:hypothetical protein